MIGEVDLESSSETVRALAEATLALVLFCDAARIDLRLLRREVGVPVRLLGIGLPLTIALVLGLALLGVAEHHGEHVGVLGVFFLHAP